MGTIVLVKKSDYNRTTGKLVDVTFKLFPEAFGAEVVRLYNEREKVAAQAVKTGKDTSPQHLKDQRTKAVILSLHNLLDYGDRTVERLKEEIEGMKP